MEENKSIVKDWEKHLIGLGSNTNISRESLRDIVVTAYKLDRLLKEVNDNGYEYSLDITNPTIKIP